MAFTVSGFKSNMSAGGGGARPTLFSVSIVSSFDATLSFTTNESLLVKATSIPAASIAALPVNYAGRAYKWNGFRTFEPWQVTIMNDETFSQRNKIMEWMRRISGKMDGGRSQKYGNHRASGDNGVFKEGTATVTQFGTDGTAKQRYKFHNMWPTELGGIPLDWSSDMIEEYPVTFAYDYWTHGTLESSENVVDASATGGGPS